MPPVVQFSPITPTSSPLASVPTTPGLRNPVNIPQEDFLAGQLDPNSATWVGGGARAAIRAGSQQLEAGLRGFGRFSFGPEDQYGQREVTDQGGNPGENYRRGAVNARSAANASGMLYSRTADMAVGEAWFRLDEQKRALFNQYSGMVSSQLQQLAANTANITGQLAGLFGDDIRYALENPQDLPGAGGAGTPATPGGVRPLDPATGGVNSGNAGRSRPVTVGGLTGESVGGGLSSRQDRFLNPNMASRGPMGGPDTPGGPMGGPDRRSPIGNVINGQRVVAAYAQAPNPSTIRARFGPNAKVVQTGDGRYIVLQEAR